MVNRNNKFWLALVFLALSPLSFAAPHKKGCDSDRRGDGCSQMPEGGTASVYLLGAGLTCLGGILVRSRLAKSNQS